MASGFDHNIIIMPISNAKNISCYAISRARASEIRYCLRKTRYRLFMLEEKGIKFVSIFLNINAIQYVRSTGFCLAIQSRKYFSLNALVGPPALE